MQSAETNLSYKLIQVNVTADAISVLGSAYRFACVSIILLCAGRECDPGDVA